MKIARVSAPEVLVRQPQDTRPLRMDCAKLLAGEVLAAVEAVRVWTAEYPGTPHAALDEEGELTLGTPEIDGAFVSIPCMGGTHGQYYYVELDLQLADDNNSIVGADGWLLVKDHDA
jgi:hypothetical protein